MDPKTSDKLRELAKTLMAGKGNRKEIAAALADGADRIEKLEHLRGALEQEAWTKFFGDCISGYLADPLVDLDEGEEMETMLRQCHRVAERGLAFWRHRWAGGASPFPTRRREHLSREELDRLPPPADVEAPAKVQAHVASVHEAIDALSEKDRTSKRRRQREELGKIKPPPVRKRSPDEPEIDDFAEPGDSSALPIPEQEDDAPPGADPPPPKTDESAPAAQDAPPAAPAAPPAPEAAAEPAPDGEKQDEKKKDESFVEGSEGSWD